VQGEKIDFYLEINKIFFIFFNKIAQKGPYGYSFPCGPVFPRLKGLRSAIADLADLWGEAWTDPDLNVGNGHAAVQS
jgi:hypothetical protein